MSTPTVCILVLNHNGRDHLATCLPSLKDQTYPSGRYQIAVVDNGSQDGSVELVRTEHPGVRLIRFDRNLGFCGAYNRAVAQCDTDYVVLLNNDTRVAPTWLEELVTVALRRRAAAVGSKIVQWDGRRVEFAGGILTFCGHAWQIGLGDPVEREYTEHEMLYACGGSMLVSRLAYLEVGGFDEDLFAYFEDVDLGWRLALRGHRTVFAPRAVTYHRLHGTSQRWAYSPRLRLYERNALAMIYKNFEDATLERVLPASIALSLARATRHSRLPSRELAPGAKPPRVWPISRKTIAQLLAIEEFACALPRLREKRRQVQSTRVRTDAELWPLFQDPLRLHFPDDPVYRETAEALIRDFGIAELVGRHPSDESPQRTRRTHREQAKGQRLKRADPTTRQGITDRPRISVIVLTTLGTTYLEPCLTSIAAQEYPRELIDVILVDNGSAVNPSAQAAAWYPGIKVVRTGSNLGFSAGNNAGARAATGEYLFFLNDDTRLDERCLAELAGAVAASRPACAGARMVTWDGKANDFAGGAINFQGKGFQTGMGERVTSPEDASLRPQLFVCGGAMMVRADVFQALGGWDERLFAYYEDIELGWRLWLAGHECLLVPAAIVFHRHHGTGGRWPPPFRIRLYERNALRTVYTHLEWPNLTRVLPAALMLVADRALLESHLGREEGESLESIAGLTTWFGRLLRRVSPAMMLRRGRQALGLRGASRHLSVRENLRRVGVRGVVWALRLVLVQTLRDTLRYAARRGQFFIELGPQSPEFDLQEEEVPMTSAAILAGLNEFLRELPRTSVRRAELQALRARHDAEILSPCASHWLAASPSARQTEHTRLHEVLVEYLDIGAVLRAGT